MPAFSINEIIEMAVQIERNGYAFYQVSAYLKTIVEGRIFNSEESAIRKAAGAADLAAVVENAIAFEKDTLLYFHALSDSISNPKALKVLRRIINEEVSHVMRLNDFKKGLA